MRFLTFNDQKRITILKYARYVHKLYLTVAYLTVGCNLTLPWTSNSCSELYGNQKFEHQPVDPEGWKVDFLLIYW